MTNGFRVKRSSAGWLLELVPKARVAKQHSHALSLVKSSSTRLRHILLNTPFPFHEITPNKYPTTERKDATHEKATRGLLETDHVILNHGQVTWTAPELAPPLLTTTPHQREDVSALDRFNVHRCPTRRVFSGTGLEPVTKQAAVRYLYHSATAATQRILIV
ncbi:uncharacterized protein TNCV_928931 [Trichonephila clavipes]|nr:uncharacterized protein TNCV_928931 [Trichonephila clavipes]